MNGFSMWRLLMSPVSLAIPVFMLVSVCVSAQPPDAITQRQVTAAAAAATLLWDSGESLPGTLVSADGQSLTWKSPLFVDPLQVELSAISSVLVPVYFTVPALIVSPPAPMALTLVVFPKSNSPALTIVSPV